MTVLVWMIFGLLGLLVFCLGWIIGGRWLHLRERERLLNAVRRFVNNPDNRELISRGAAKFHQIISLIGREDFEAAKRQLRVLGIPF